ncbi:MAG: hypothetical protein ACFFBP_18775 [Promethearchaeota archaeon]
MGIITRIKEIFEKKQIEFDSLKELETELVILKKKTNSKIIAIIGSGGRLKGLPLIYDADDENLLKIYTAKINELLIPIRNLADDKELTDFIINYKDSIILFKNIIENIGFLAFTRFSNDIALTQQWLFKNEIFLKKIFEQKV